MEVKVSFSVSAEVGKGLMLITTDNIPAVNRLHGYSLVVQHIPHNANSFN